LLGKKYHKFDLKDKIENHKNCDKKIKKKNQEIKRRMTELKFLLLKKNKNHKIDLNDKIESIKILTKGKKNRIRNQK
jgi:hypothetical protein